MYSYRRRAILERLSSIRVLRSSFIKLFAVLLLYSSINYFWLSYDIIPPAWDSSMHLMSAMKYRGVVTDFVEEFDFSARTLFRFLKRLVRVNRGVYPPLFPFLASFTIWGFGGEGSADSLTMVNTLFGGILLFSLYQIGKKIYDEESGVLSGVIILFYPMVAGLSRAFMLEFPLLAMTALSLYFLLYSERFRNKTYTILFGISLGLGMLTKPTFLTFVIVPFGYVACLAAFEIFQSDLRSWDRLRRLSRLLIPLAVGVLIAGVWYGPNFRSFITVSKAVSSMGADVFSVSSILYYLNAMAVYQIGLLFLALFVFGLLRLNKYVNKQDAWLLLLWGLSIYLIHTLVPHKTVRQDIGILLPVCVISAIGISSLGRWRKLTIGLVGLVGLLQFLSFSLPEPFFADKLGRFEWAYKYAALDYGARPPKEEDWKIEEALRSLGNQEIKVGVLSDHVSINGQTFSYYAHKLNLPFQIIKCRDYSNDFIENLFTYDFVILKSDWVPVTGLRGNPFVREDVDLVLMQHFQDNIYNFTLFQSLPLPDGSEMLVYQKTRTGREIGQADRGNS